MKTRPALNDLPAQRRIFGEPIGLWFLALTEAWERFSYYGMSGILVLYMQQSLLLSPHVERIVGFEGFRNALETVFGPMSRLGLASQIFGLYAGFIYFTPVFGGMIADRWIGRRAAVMLGAILMSGGHIAMAFDQSFLLALVLLILGCGLLKGNISAQVGQFYPKDDADGRTRGFAIFSVGINIGAIAGPLACGLLAQLYGWHIGFAAAGVLMLIGLATYLIGYRHMPAAQPRDVSARHTPLDRAQWKTVALLMLVIALTIFQSIIYYQNSDAALIWIDAYVDLDFLGFRVPVAWFNSIDPLASVVFVPPLLAWWKRQNARGREPNELAKIITGLWIAIAANLILVLACLPGGRVPVIAPVVYDVLLGLGFLYYWPTMLALVSRAAPPQVNATMMGIVFLSLFVAYTLIGRLGGFYDRMTPVEFWGMHAGLGLVGAILLMLLRRPIERGLGLERLPSA